MILKKLCLVLLLTLGTASAYSQEFLLPTSKSIQQLLEISDSDKDKKITVEDKITKPMPLISTSGDRIEIRKVYYLSNLLQELALAAMHGQDSVRISMERIKEPASSRISRRIREVFWEDLTRTIDRQGLVQILRDPKAEDPVKRLYVPVTDTAGIKYFKGLTTEFQELEVVVLPGLITPEYVRSLNDQPGLLSLKIVNGKGVPFVVPGGRFNEMYGWDSYFIGLGLIIDGKVQLAKAMVDNLVYQIQHYGKILNANRSYYLTRTQPPFLTSFIIEVYEALPEKDTRWLRRSVQAAIKEYEEVWMEEGVRLTKNGLNRYYGEGIGIPPETEPGHFARVLAEFAEKHGMLVEDFISKYRSGEIEDPELDLYFRHDRSLRESGHDTSWRLENRAAWLNTVDLNALLYKYEKDIEYLIDTYFGGNFIMPSGTTYTAGDWTKMAAKRKQLMDQYLWNAEAESYFDYQFISEKQTTYISATNFYPLWAEIPAQERAGSMVQNLMKDLKTRGGILASTKASVESVADNNIQRQWDYPFGWAPHQILLWRGLLNYGYAHEAHELIYRWLWMITKNAVDYNGTIPEKYDVVHLTHKVYAEYGNVGTEFDYITTSGFGWMNASYQLGLKLLPESYVKELNNLTPPDQLFE